MTAAADANAGVEVDVAEADVAEADVAEADVAEADAVPARGPVVYEFGAPSKLSDEKLALYREAGRQIAVDIEAAIGEWVPDCSVDAEPPREVTADSVLVSADGTPTDQADFDVVPLTIAGVVCGTIATELRLALSLIGGALGGPPDSEIEARPLTSIEARVLDLIGAAGIEAACRTLLIDGAGIGTAEWPSAPTPERSRRDGFRADDDEESKDLVAFGFSVEVGGERGSLVIAFDLATLQRFSDVVDTRLAGHQRVVPVQPSPLAPLALRPVPLKFAVRVGTAELTAREVVELRAGDVIKTRVPVDAELIALAGDTALFQVKPGQRGNRLIAEIISPIVREADR